MYLDFTEQQYIDDFVIKPFGELMMIISHKITNCTQYKLLDMIMLSLCGLYITHLFPQNTKNKTAFHHL